MFVKKLESVTRADSDVGQKVIGLGELLKLGMPVPSAFVITGAAYLKFLTTNKIHSKIEKLLSEIDYENLQDIIEKSSQIRNLITNAQIPDFITNEIKAAYEELSVGKEVREVGGIALEMIKAGRGREYVSVRPSVILDSGYMIFPYRSALNIAGISELLSAVKDCWASVFNPESLVYRNITGFNRFPVIALLVQKMINPEKSGFIFTTDPITGDSNRMILESSWGIGSAISEGIVTPDIYIIEKDTGKITSKKIAKKLWQYVKNELSGRTIRESVPRDKLQLPVLSDSEIRKIWEMAKKVEDCFGKPYLIGWCIERNKISITSAEPLLIKSNGEHESLDTTSNEKRIITGIPSSPGRKEGLARIINEVGVIDIKNDEIIVTRDASQDILLFVNAAGFVTNEGGISSKCALFCRGLGKPLITGTETSTSVISDGQRIIIDAFSGIIYEQTEQLHEMPTELPETGMISKVINEDDKITATEIKISLSYPELPQEGIENIDGVGLLKSEHILTGSGTNPYHMASINPESVIENIVVSVEKIARVFHPKPVWYRLLDLKTDEMRYLEGSMDEKEQNPVLGWHGIRRGIDDRNLLRCEIEAIRRIHNSGLNNVNIILPFVSRTEEVRDFIDLLEFPVKIGVMIETPASAIDIEKFCKLGVKYVCIDLDNLTQLVFGADRSIPKLSSVYYEEGVIKEPVKFLLDRTIRTCNNYGIEISVTGENITSPQVIEELIKLGVRSIIVDPADVEIVRSLVLRTEKKLLLDRFREHNSKTDYFLSE